MRGSNLNKRASETKEEKQLREMQDPSYWDFDHPQKVLPVKGPRVVVSVALSNTEFEVIAAEAERTGKPVSRFIREAAVAAAAGKGSGGVILYGGSGYGAAVFQTQAPPVTLVRGYPVVGVDDQMQANLSA